MAQTALQNTKAQELRNTLENLIAGYKENPEEIAELLAFKNRFYSYSMNNNILIYSQNPYATFVSSYEDWKKKGYQVLRGQHGIKIIFPIRTEIFIVGEKDGKKQYRRVTDASPEEKSQIESGLIKPFTTTRFGVGNVFDISQTDCPADDYPKIYHTGYSSDQHSVLYGVVKQFAISKGIPVVEKDLQSISLRGQFFPLTGKITISDKLGDTEKLSTLTHELGHALLHGDPASRDKDTSIKELEADCISIMLQQEFGILLTDSRKRHFVEHYNVCSKLNDFKLEDVLRNVSSAYLNLRKELDPAIEASLSGLSSYKEETKPDVAETSKRETSANDKVTVDHELTAAEPQTGIMIQGFRVEDNVYQAEVLYNGKTFYPAVRSQADQMYIMVGSDVRNRLRYNFTDEQVKQWEAFYKKEQEVVPVKEDPPVVTQAKQPAAPDKNHIKPKTDFKDFHEQDAAVLDYIKHGVSILTVATDLGFTVQEFGKYFVLKEFPHSSRIYPETNSFASFSEQQNNGKTAGGSTIDFVMNYSGYNKKEAIQLLKDRYVGDRFESLPRAEIPAPAAKTESKEFVLPEHAQGKFARTFAYLTKTRCLDADIVQKCMKDGLIYEDNKHNVIFVGKDAEGKSVYAARHTTLTHSDFKGDVAGSQQGIGFMVNNKASKLYVTEAPIDALSIMCLRKRQGKPLDAANYLATCSTGKYAALYYRLDTSPNIKEVVLANDNDEAGQKANQKISEHLREKYPNIKVSCIKPKEKDFNEHLCKFCTPNCGAKSPKKSVAKEVKR